MEVHVERDREVRRPLVAAAGLLRERQPVPDDLVARLLAVETVETVELEQMLALDPTWQQPAAPRRNPFSEGT